MLSLMPSVTWSLVLLLGPCSEFDPGVVVCTPQRMQTETGMTQAECETVMAVHLARPFGLIAAECTDGRQSVGAIVAAGEQFEIVGD
jgi:3-deoxy-D-arabino-heptulosonate 7-phosphate (DAHP) synthase